MRITLLFGGIMFLLLVSIGAMYGGSEPNYTLQNRSIHNITDKLDWNNRTSLEVQTRFANMTNLDYSTISQERIKNVVYMTVNYFGSLIFEFSKWSIEYGYYHPESKNNVIYYAKTIVWIAIILLAIPAITPLLALLYLIGRGIYSLGTKIFSK